MRHNQKMSTAHSVSVSTASKVSSPGQDIKTELGYDFRYPSYMHRDVRYDKWDLPQDFKATPDTLQNLSVIALDAQPLPAAYNWSLDDVTNWLCQLGYAAYVPVFRANFITGRRLQLIDANALIAMRIGSIRDIRELCQAVRRLFGLAWPQQLSLEAARYRQHISRTGGQYERVRKSDFLRPKFAAPMTHWDLLESITRQSAGLKQHEIRFGRTTQRRKRMATLKRTSRLEVSPPRSAVFSELYESITDSDS